MEEYKMGGLSTANLSKKTYDALAGGELGPYSVTYEYGLFVHVPDTEEDEEPCPRDLSRVLKYCRKNGVDWIKFDSDETPDAKLPLYQWSDDCFTIKEAVEHHGWSIDCDMIPDCKEMEVMVFFAGESEIDSTEFIIKPFDAAELQGLFEDFCVENGYACNRVNSVMVTRVSAEEVEG